MPQRLDYTKLAPQGLAALRSVEHYLNTATNLEPSLLELVRLRASLINGCDYCIGLHTHELHKHNEPGSRIAEVANWQTSTAYTQRERAALAWTETITDIHPDHAPDALFEATRQHFTDAELVNLTLAIAAINAWNRLAIAFRAEHAPK
jgi:AhpD family alkylhydroperoxidase